MPLLQTRYSKWLRAGRFGDRIPVGARFSSPDQTGPGGHPASCTVGTGSFPGVKSGRGVTLAPHPFLVPWSRKSRAIPLLLLWFVRPVQSLSACTRVHFSFLFATNENVATESLQFTPYDFCTSRPTRWPDLGKCILKCRSETFSVNIS